jgi:hypothetical protein
MASAGIHVIIATARMEPVPMSRLGRVRLNLTRSEDRQGEQDQRQAGSKE